MDASLGQRLPSDLHGGCVTINTLTVVAADRVTGLTSTLSAQFTVQRVMFDAAADHAASIPPDAPIVGGGPKWTAAEWALFPNAVHVPILESATAPPWGVRDVETRFIWPPAAVVPAIRTDQAAGYRGTVYCWQGNLQATDTALAAAGLTRRVCYWVADATGTPHAYVPPFKLLAGDIIGTQWCNYTNGPIPNVDQSLITDDGWLVSYR